MNNEAIEDAQQSLDAQEAVRKVQLFRAQAFQFGVFETEIATIAEWREPTPLPHAPESVLGLVSVQGRMLTVLDLAILTRLAGGETVSDDGSYRYIIALRGDEQLALAVSDLGETIEFSDSDFAGATKNDERFVLGVLRCRGTETKILNVTELFPAALHGRERRRRRF